MEADDRILKLLEQIRDAQREHLAEYRSVTKRSLELQQEALGRQQELGRLYRRVLVIGGGVGTVLLILLAYLLARWSHALFR